MKSEFIQVTESQANNLALSHYVGRVCSICGEVWDTLDKLKEADPICSEKNENGLKFACRKCWDAKEGKGVRE